MPSRTRTLTLSIASMAAVLSLALSTPNATAAPPDQEPGAPSTSIQTTAPATDPPPTSEQAETPSTEPTEPTSSTPATEAPSTSESAPTTSSEAPPSSDTSAPSTSTATPPERKPQSRAAAVAAGCQTYPPTSYQVCGRIRDKYNQTGGPNGFLLFPKSNELTNPNNTGKRSEFLGGNIYWSTATDAHPVAHEFLTKWGEKGYESGYMKYPTTDEIVLGDGTSRRQEYQGASIYFNFSTGAHIVQGNIREYWRGLGAETSDLGFPTSDEQQIGDKYYNTFQGGTVYWSASAGYEVFGALKNFRHEASSGGDCDIVTDDPDCSSDNNQADIRDKIQRCVATPSTMSPTVIVFLLTGSSKFPNPLKVTCGQYRHINEDHKIELDRERGLQCMLMTYAKGQKKPQVDVSNPIYRGIDYYNPNLLNVRSTIIYDPTLNTDYGKPNVVITAYAGTGEGRDWGGCVYGYLK